MKLLILTAILAVVKSSPLAETNQWPWQVGQEYVYDVDSYTWTKYEQSINNGNAFSAKFIIRILEPGRLLAKLVNPLYGQFQDHVSRDAPIKNLNLSPLQDIDHPFEIFVNGGRIVSLKVPTSLSVTNENLLKGLVSGLQVDLSTFNHVDSFPNHFDKETFQGLFKKMETDVTGNCETLYSVSPSTAAEENIRLPVDNRIEIIKSKNYGSCKKRVGFTYGVPDGAVWNGIAFENNEKQFVKHTTESRLVVSKQGTIYKSETVSTVFVNPLIFGKQKAEVHSYVTFYLESVKPENNDDVWKKSVKYREVDSLLFTYDHAKFTKGTKNVADAQKLLQEMTPLFQDPNNLPKAEFLSKFNILVRSVMFMTSEQLTQMTASIEVARSSENSAKKNMWVVYRDAVAQAGSIAAFKEIKSWILTKKIEGIEAAAVISSMANILHFPTKEVMNEFFELTVSPEVQQQSFLNTTTLLAVTKFIASGDEDLFVNEKVIPRLSQELKQAVENGDKNKAQVYVRVLGNLAHPNILKVFAPYLEGKIAVTKYLRIQMVISLKTLANKKNEYVRAVLFSLLKNTAEPYEVRVAAALNIFLADPPQEMMQIMGHMTFADPSTQVRAVLANSITFAAGLKDPRFATLAKTAKSVLSMLPEEKFGYRYSTDSLIDDYTSDDELSHFREVSYIGSKNNLLPVYERGALRFGSTGWTEEDWFTLSVSDMQHLMEYIYSLFIHQGEKPKDEFEIKIKTILEKLNIKPEHQCDLEGSFFLNNWNQQMLLTFTEAEINSLILSLIKESNHLKQSIKSNYIKIVLQKDIFITFPLAMGMPFVFEYSEPTLLHVQNQAIATPGEDMSGNIIDKLQFTYARNLDGIAGYLDTFNDVYVAAGVVNKLQLHIPFRTRWDYEFNEFKFILEWPDRNANLIHMSVWPYTTLQKTDSLQTAAENPQSKLIERPKKVISTDIKFGQSIGTVFQFQANSYSSDYKDPTSLFDNDLLTNVRNLLYQKDIALTQFNLKYLPRESKNKAFTFTVFTNTIYNQLQTKDEFEPAAVIKDITPEARRKEIINRVASEIEHGKVQLVDISLEFLGRETVEFILTGALANSYVDNKVHAALLYNGFQQQINAVFNMTKPEFTPLNFELALKDNLTIEYDLDILIGNEDNIHLKGVGKRSDMYKELLLNDPLGKQCLKDIGENNLYQKACYKMLLKAHAPDYFKGTLTYKDLKQTDEAFILNLLELLENWNDWEKEQDVLKTVDDGKLEIEAQAFYYDNYINYKLTSKFGEVRLNNVEGLSYYPYAMSFYAPLSSWERARNWFTGYQNLPFCTVDDNKVWTFSGRSYEYNMTGSWHVVMVDEAKDFGNELLILAQRPEKGQTEVYITYKTRTGKTLEIILTPKTYQVISNAKEICEDGVSIYYDDVAKIPLVEYYSIRGGFDEIQVFSINNGAIRLIFDNHRLVLFTDDHRSTTRGLCGQSSTEIRDDYMTPFGLVDSPQLYGASFALDGDHADPKTEELKKEAKLKAYQPVTKYTSILRSDAEWSKVANESF